MKTQAQAQRPKMATQEQRSFLVSKLSRLGDFNYLMEFTRQVTGGRTWDIRELTYEEAVRFMYFLDGRNKKVIKMYEEAFGEDYIDVKKRKDELRQSIYELARVMGLIYGHTPEDHEMNKAKLNIICRTKGPIRKGLSYMSSNELIDTVSWFESLYGSYTKSKNKEKWQKRMSL